MLITSYMMSFSVRPIKTLFRDSGFTPGFLIDKTFAKILDHKTKPPCDLH